MNIWAWVNAAERDLREHGNGRLADLVDRLPSAVCDNEHAVVDALYPEALALAKATGNPWLELFVRHWNLQSRVLHRMDVGEWTGEAVSLLEFASREGIRECPQAICVTQDLVNSYGKVDGPGFAEERLGVTEETLARIDAAWPCFRCISAERVEAMLDSGQAKEALEFVEAQTEAMRAAGKRARLRSALGDSRCEALLQLGRHEAALAEVEANLPESGDENERLRRRIIKARVLVAMGHADAAAQLPSFEETFETPSFYADWADAAVGLARASGGTWKLDAQLRRMQARLTAQGVRRNAIEIAVWRGQLAVTRGHMHTVADAVEAIEALMPGLHRPLDAPAKLAALQAQVTPAVVPEFESAQAAIEASGGDPECDVPVLEAALLRWPEDETLVSQLAAALRALARPEVAEARLRAYLRAQPDAVDVFASLASALLEQNDHAGIESLTAEILATEPPKALVARCLWMRAHSRRTRDPEAARADYARVIELDPPARNATILLAQMEREAGELESALARLDSVCADSPETGSWDWDRMVVATLLERWDAVRDSAARIGYTLQGEGPVHFDGGLCKIKVQDDGDEQTLLAQRTGPVTADIVQLSPPERVCHYHDTVVFDATPLNEGPAEGEEANHRWVYPCIAITDPGTYTNYIVDGVHPQEFQLEMLQSSMRGLGCVWSKRSGSKYQLKHPETGVDLQGLYVYLAIPARVSVAKVHAALRDLVAPFEHPLTWIPLAAEAGDGASVASQKDAFARYGM